MSVCQSVHQSVCLSVTKTPQPLRIAPINHWAYWPSSLSTIEPIDHRAYQPLSLSTIEPLDHHAHRSLSLSTNEAIDHRTYQPSSLSTSGLLSRILSLSACSFIDQDKPTEAPLYNHSLPSIICNDTWTARIEGIFNVRNPLWWAAWLAPDGVEWCFIWFLLVCISACV